MGYSGNSQSATVPFADVIALQAAIGLLPMLLPSWMDPEQLIKSFGPYALWGVAFVIFAEGCWRTTGVSHRAWQGSQPLAFTTSLKTFAPVMSARNWAGRLSGTTWDATATCRSSAKTMNSAGTERDSV